MVASGKFIKLNQALRRNLKAEPCKREKRASSLVPDISSCCDHRPVERASGSCVDGAHGSLCWMQETDAAAQRRTSRGASVGAGDSN